VGATTVPIDVPVGPNASRVTSTAGPLVRLVATRPTCVGSAPCAVVSKVRVTWKVEAARPPIRVPSSAPSSASAESFKVTCAPTLEVTPTTFSAPSSKVSSTNQPVLARTSAANGLSAAHVPVKGVWKGGAFVRSKQR
jgi:hypothetical protein